MSQREGGDIFMPWKKEELDRITIILVIIIIMIIIIITISYSNWDLNHHQDL